VRRELGSFGDRSVHREVLELERKLRRHRVIGAQQLVLTSYDTFRELRAARLSDRALSGRLQETARQLLL